MNREKQLIPTRMHGTPCSAPCPLVYSTVSAGPKTFRGFQSSCFNLQKSPDLYTNGIHDSRIRYRPRANDVSFSIVSVKAKHRSAKIMEQQQQQQQAVHIYEKSILRTVRSLSHCIAFREIDTLNCLDSKGS